MKKILLIEDEKLIRDLLAKKLTAQGYEVIMTHDGEEGLNEMRRNKPDLILLDMIMPKMGGIEVMEEIQKDVELKAIPVIIVSNSGQPVELDLVKKLGARDWLIKTEFDPAEVLVKVRKQLDGK